MAKIENEFISSCAKKCTGPILQNRTSKRCTKLSCFGSEEVNAPRILNQYYWKFQNEELSSIFDFSCSKFEQKKACLRQKLQHEANCHAHVTKYRWAVGNVLGGFQPLDEALKCYISISTRQLNLEKMVTQLYPKSRDVCQEKSSASFGGYQSGAIPREMSKQLDVTMNPRKGNVRPIPDQAIRDCRSTLAPKPSIGKS